MVIYDVHNIPDNPKANEFSDNLFKNVNAMSGDALYVIFVEINQQKLLIPTCISVSASNYMNGNGRKKNAFDLS